MSVAADRSLIRFGLVGMLNTAVGLAVIFFAKALLDWGDLASNVLGYAVGLATSFMLNRNWTFEHHGAISAALLRFLAAFLSAYAINLMTVFGMRDLASIDAYLAQAVGVIPFTVCFYLLGRNFVFSHTPEKNSDPRHGPSRASDTGRDPSSS